VCVCVCVIDEAAYSYLNVPVVDAKLQVSVHIMLLYVCMYVCHANTLLVK